MHPRWAILASASGRSVADYFAQQSKHSTRPFEDAVEPYFADESDTDFAVNIFDLAHLTATGIESLFSQPRDRAAATLASLREELREWADPPDRAFYETAFVAAFRHDGKECLRILREMVRVSWTIIESSSEDAQV